MSDSTSSFAELKDNSGGGKAEVAVPINTSKPLPTTVPIPDPQKGGPSATYSTLFLPTTLPPYTFDWFLHFLKQTRVLVILALALFFLILLIWVASIGHAPPYTESVAASDCSDWQRSEIIPDVITQCPPARAQIYYPSTSGRVNMGGLIPTNSADEMPSAIFVPGATPSGYYTAIFLAPDSPTKSEPGNRSALKGLVTNLRLSESVDPNSGEWIFPYEPPTPEAGTGEHRYVWLVYRHSTKTSRLQTPGRLRFDVEKWFSEAWPQRPTLVAANYFTARPSA